MYPADAGRLLWLLLTTLALSGCRAEPAPAALGATGGEAEATPERLATPSPPAAGDTLPADRNPETDPWLFEGIPNFEDLVQGREGDWVVVLASSRRSGGAPAPTIMASSDPGIASVQRRAWNAGYVPFVVASEALPGLEPRFVVAVLGPFARGDAERHLAVLRETIGDAYIAKGW